jgi:hypothetical protein
MRAVLGLSLLPLLVAAVATGVAGAQSQATAVVTFTWTGTAFEHHDYRGNNAVYETRTDVLMWSATCSIRIEEDRLRPGEALFCKDSNVDAAGRINVDWLNGHPERDCTGSVSYRKGFPWEFGGTIVLGTVIRALAPAPIGASHELDVRSSNPGEADCDAMSFAEPDVVTRMSPARPTDPTFRFNYNIRWPTSGVYDKAWSGRSSDGNIRTQFTGAFGVNVDFTTAVGAELLDSLSRMVSNLWTTVVDRFGSSPTLTVQSADDGLLQGTWTTSGQSRRFAVASRASGAITIGSVRQTLTSGRAAPLRLKITPQGRALLAGATSSPTIKGTLTFTPRHGGRVTLRTTFAPPLLPSIESVRFSGGPANPTVSVLGRGLTPLPRANPRGTPAGHNGCPTQSGNYGMDYGSDFNLNDLTKNWSGGLATPATTSCIGLIPTKVTGGEIDFRLGSFYTNLYPRFSLSPGDDVQVVVSGAARDVVVKYSG